MKTSLLKIGGSVAVAAALAGVAAYHWIEEAPIGFADVSFHRARAAANMSPASVARQDLCSRPAGPMVPERQSPKIGTRSNLQPAVATFSQSRSSASDAGSNVAGELVAPMSGERSGEVRSSVTGAIAVPTAATAFESQSGWNASLAAPRTPAIPFPSGTGRPGTPLNSSRDTAA